MRRRWVLEECFTLLKAIELRVSALGYHVCMIEHGRPRTPRLDVLELGIYPNVKASDHANIRSLLSATELKLRGIDDLEEPKTIGLYEVHRVSTYEYGKGKNTREVLVYFQELAEETATTTA